MSSNKRCPECRQWMNKNSVKCGCGWKSEEDDSTYVPNGQCLYQALGRRCPLPAPSAANLLGPGRWYCTGHLRNLGNAKRCEEILIEAENNFEAIMENRIDWRITHYPEEYRKMKVLISELSRNLNK